MYKINSKSAEGVFYNIEPSDAEIEEMNEYVNTIKEFKYSRSIIHNKERQIISIQTNFEDSFDFEYFPERAEIKTKFSPLIYCNSLITHYNKTKVKEYDYPITNRNKPRMIIPQSLNTVEAIEKKLEEIIKKSKSE
jgi:hypothetical protein